VGSTRAGCGALYRSVVAALRTERDLRFVGADAPPTGACGCRRGASPDLSPRSAAQAARTRPKWASTGGARSLGKMALVSCRDRIVGAMPGKQTCAVRRF